MEYNHTENSNFDPKNELEQLAARFLTVVELLTPGRGGLRALSKMTGISYARWRNALAGRSAPSIDMIIGLSKMKPEWLEWMLTGKTSVSQTAPSDQDLKRAEYLQKISRPVPGVIGDPYEGWAPGNALLLDETLRLAKQAEISAADLLNQDNS